MVPQVTSLEKAQAQMPTLDEVVSQCKQVRRQPSSVLCHPDIGYWSSSDQCNRQCVR